MDKNARVMVVSDLTLSQVVALRSKAERLVVLGNEIDNWTRDGLDPVSELAKLVAKLRAVELDFRSIADEILCVDAGWENTA